MIMMELMISATASASPTLVAGDDFANFKVVVHNGAQERQRPELGSIGHWVDDDHVAVFTEAVRRLAGDRAATAEWGKGFSAMLGYAESKGWIADDAIRAHVEWE
jgi:hypothetical protein